MRKTLTFFSGIIMGLMSLFPVQGQTQNRMERLNAQKVAFFTNRLKLTPEEAQNFWPVYNEYQQKKNELTLAKRKILQEINGNSDSMQDDQLERLSDEFVGYDLKLAELQSTYHEKFKQVLPIRKVLRMYQVEQQFTAFLLRQIQNQRQTPVRRRRF